MFQQSNFTKLFIIAVLFIASSIFAQNKSMHMQMKDMKTEKQSTDSSIVRKGIIDLKSIDKNNDGKVYQCPMEANVLSDEKGECPLCGMDIKEVTIEKAKEKLLKRGFKVSETELKENPGTVNKSTDTKLSIWNKVCPVTGEDVDTDTPTEVYQGKTIGFCCSGCIKKFKKDPEKYMKNLSEDGSKFLDK
ncbi:MAG: YHS domain-containing protein [Ignavibacteriales bacterium]|nr:YHS domain-containing protein [Ignavibacteriales bacterium]